MRPNGTNGAPVETTPKGAPASRLSGLVGYVESQLFIQMSRSLEKRTKIRRLFEEIFKDFLSEQEKQSSSNIDDFIYGINAAIVVAGIHAEYTSATPTGFAKTAHRLAEGGNDFTAEEMTKAVQTFDSHVYYSPASYPSNEEVTTRFALICKGAQIVIKAIALGHTW